MDWEDIKIASIIPVTAAILYVGISLTPADTNKVATDMFRKEVYKKRQEHISENLNVLITGYNSKENIHKETQSELEKKAAKLFINCKGTESKAHILDEVGNTLIANEKEHTLVNLDSKLIKFHLANYKICAADLAYQNLIVYKENRDKASYASFNTDTKEFYEFGKDLPKPKSNLLEKEDLPTIHMSPNGRYFGIEQRTYGFRRIRPAKINEHWMTGIISAMYANHMTVYDLKTKKDAFTYFNPLPRPVPALGLKDDGSIHTAIGDIKYQDLIGD